MHFQEKIFQLFCLVLVAVFCGSCKNLEPAGNKIIGYIQESALENHKSGENNPCYKAENFICEIETEIHRLTNYHRMLNGCAALEHHPGVSFVSRSWSKEQGKRGLINHDGFNEKRYAVYRAEFSRRDVYLERENVGSRWFNPAKNVTSREIAKSFVDGWMESPGHKLNMLAKGIEIQGAGVVKVENEYYGTIIFGNKFKDTW